MANIIEKTLRAILAIGMTIPWLIMPILYQVGMFLSPRLMDKLNRLAGHGKPKLPGLENMGNFMGSSEIVKYQFKTNMQEALKDAHLGSEPPNVPLLELKSGKEVRLLDFMKGDRPLVINFGSCS